MGRAFSSGIIIFMPTKENHEFAAKAKEDTNKLNDFDLKLIDLGAYDDSRTNNATRGLAKAVQAILRQEDEGCANCEGLCEPNNCLLKEDKITKEGSMESNSAEVSNSN